MLFLSEVNGFTCGGTDILRIIKFVKIIIDAILIIVPMGLIILVCLDFGKNVISGKDDEIKKNLNLAIKRILFCAALFLITPIVDIVISLVGANSETYLGCIGIAKQDDLWKYKIVWDYYPYNETEPISKGGRLNADTTTTAWVEYSYTKKEKQEDGTEKIQEEGKIRIYEDGTYEKLP